MVEADSVPRGGAGRRVPYTGEIGLDGPSSPHEVSAASSRRHQSRCWRTSCSKRWMVYRLHDAGGLRVRLSGGHRAPRYGNTVPRLNNAFENDFVPAIWKNPWGLCVLVFGVLVGGIGVAPISGGCLPELSGNRFIAISDLSL